MREEKGRRKKEKENDSEGRSRRGRKGRKGRRYASGLKPPPPNQKCWLRPCLRDNLCGSINQSEHIYVGQ